MKKSLERLIQTLTEGLIERDIPSRLILLSALAGEHSLLIGPPGTAKSVLARKLHGLFTGGDYFERLLTRFSVPEELFGPLSIKALEEDQYHRLTEHYLPSASIAFIDEIFKANSAILNSLLTILNEGVFDNGSVRMNVPLISVIAASNELPEQSELEALYDRFLVRCQVQPISEHQFKALLTLPTASGGALQESDKLTAADINEIQQQAEFVELPDEVILLLQSMRDHLNQHQQYVSDRRWRKIVKLLQVSAYTNGQQQVSIWDCWLLQFCLWNVPEEQGELASYYESHLGIGTGFYPERLEKLISTWEETFKADAASEVQRVNLAGHKLYLDQDQRETTKKMSKKWLHRNLEPLYFAPQGQDDRDKDGAGYTRNELQEKYFDSHYKQTHIDGRWQHIDEYICDPENHLILEKSNTPSMEPARHSEVFIKNRVKEASQVHADLAEHQQGVQAFLRAAEEDILKHLWIDSSFKQTAVAHLQQSWQQIEELVERINLVIEGYHQLPRL